jgi:tetratricopeptide (TPR) repeat protein
MAGTADKYTSAVGCPDDNALAAALAGTLPSADEDELERHLDGCGRCAELFAAIARGGGGTVDTEAPTEAHYAASARHRLAAGTVVDRFVVEAHAGAGGMGDVYRARDEQLGRRVAIKLLRARTDTDAARLLCEAQALARLAHPNVVVVHEVGVFGDQAFVVMEHVDGVTLREWLRGRPGWREVLTMFRQAGAGLAAAHSVGIVHRDFKPGNVIVGADGRARVVDFGLARTVGAAEPPSGGAATPVLADLTTDGNVVGTPAYMSPEQRRGDAVDARSDEYSFCVALREALAGARGRVPARIGRALARGLAPDPDDRFPSMAALLAALPAERRAARGLALVAAGGVAMAAAALVARPWTGSPCAGAGDALAGSWNPERQAAIRASFARSGRPHAAATAERAIRVLDDYGRRWAVAQTQACAATAIQRTQSPQLLDARTRCLDARLGALGALARLLGERHDVEVVDDAVTASASLPRLEPCADLDALAAVYPPPDDPTARRTADEIGRRLDGAEALLRVGKHRDALASAAGLRAAARAVGWPPLVARAELVVGNAEAEAADPALAQASLEEAARVAGRARDDATVAAALTSLVWVIGFKESRSKEGLALRPAVEAAIARVGDAPLLRANLLYNVGVVLTGEKAFPAALEALGEAARLRIAELGADSPFVARVYGAMGNALNDDGRFEDARDKLERAHAIFAAALGADNPYALSAENNSANSLLLEERFAEAEQRYRSILPSFESVYGPGSRQVSVVLANLAIVLEKQQRYAEALADYQRALAIREQILGRDHVGSTDVMTDMAELYHLLHRDAEAVATLERVVAIRAARDGADGVTLVVPLSQLARVLLETGRPADAVATEERTLAIARAKLRRGHPHLRDILLILGQGRLALGQTAPALAALEEAAAVEAPASAAENGALDLALAEALVATHKDPTRARRLAQEAAEAFAAGHDAAQSARARALLTRLGR